MSTPQHARILRTDAEIWQAGWDDGANDPPPTQAQIDRIAPLLATHLPLATSRTAEAER